MILKHFALQKMAVFMPLCLNGNLHQATFYFQIMAKIGVSNCTVWILPVSKREISVLQLPLGYLYTLFLCIRQVSGFFLQESPFQ